MKEERERKRERRREVEKGRARSFFSSFGAAAASSLLRSGFLLLSPFRPFLFLLRDRALRSGAGPAEEKESRQALQRWRSRRGPRKRERHFVFFQQARGRCCPLALSPSPRALHFSPTLLLPCLLCRIVVAVLRVHSLGNSPRSRAELQGRFVERRRSVFVSASSASSTSSASSAAAPLPRRLQSPGRVST